MTIFRKDGDFQAFLKTMAEGLKRFDVELLAWCLMEVIRGSRPYLTGS
jgi:hypothetical protein